jgi:predicted metalloprotease with PDZ domain
MVNRVVAAFVAAAFLGLQAAPDPAYAENRMNYQLLTADQASALTKGGGRLGLNVSRADQITSSGLTFDLLRVNSVSTDSPGARAGFKVGDQIIAVDGKVFPSAAAFASYVGSKQPNDQISIDYMPPNSGPKDAQRVNVTMASADRSAPQPKPTESGGLSTGTKIAIGLGAAALFGCYKLGCFHRRTPAAAQQR